MTLSAAVQFDFVDSETEESAVVSTGAPRAAPTSWRARSGSTTIQFENCDALNFMHQIEPGTIDIIVTSPPYNIGLTYGHYDDSQPRQDYLEWLERWADLAKSVLKEDGSLFFNVGCKPTDPWVPLQAAATVAGSRDVFQLHHSTRFKLQNTIHWIKSISIDPESVGHESMPLSAPLSVGHYKPIAGERFLNDTHEYLFHFTKSGRTNLRRRAIGVPYTDKSNVTRWPGVKEDKRCRGNCWFVPYSTIKSRAKQRPHPATFPVGLARWAIELHGPTPRTTVLDPFLGIGTTALACVDAQVSCLGTEVDPDYFKDAVERVANHIG